jgi:hypothetical protein
MSLSVSQSLWVLLCIQLLVMTVSKMDLAPSVELLLRSSAAFVLLEVSLVFIRLRASYCTSTSAVDIAFTTAHDKVSCLQIERGGPIARLSKGLRVPEALNLQCVSCRSKCARAPKRQRAWRTWIAAAQTVLESKGLVGLYSNTTCQLFGRRHHSR